MNISDADGDTALHLALVRETIASITVDTPEMDKVKLCLILCMHYHQHVALTCSFVCNNNVFMYIYSTYYYSPNVLICITTAIHTYIISSIL